jgi:hypothetical protein
MSYASICEKYSFAVRLRCFLAVLIVILCNDNYIEEMMIQKFYRYTKNSVASLNIPEQQGEYVNPKDIQCLYLPVDKQCIHKSYV